MVEETGDAEILINVSRRLFQESFRTFKEAHGKWERSLRASSVGEHLTLFGEAVEQERRAIEMQREALELRRHVLALRSESFARLKAALDS